MNYLAHAYLSFNQPDILVGNMISDFLKGKTQYDYSPAIQKGIQLHRAIDTFTDTHEITRYAKQYLKPAVGAYAGAFIDVVYDHFLAIDKNEFTSTSSLQSFATKTCDDLECFEDVLPQKFKNMLPSMRKENWLYNYQFGWGIEKSFDSVTRRAKYLTSHKDSFELFEKHYVHLQDCYRAFFPLLKKFSEEFIATEDNHL